MYQTVKWFTFINLCLQVVFDEEVKEGPLKLSSRGEVFDSQQMAAEFPRLIKIVN